MITTSLLALSACLALCSRLPLPARVSLALALVAGFLALYSLEAFLQWREVTRVRRAANRLGRSYDARSGAQVLEDFRRAGKDAWPAMSSGDLLRGEEEPTLLPLGGISGVLTVACNEIGVPLIYPSDGRGFLNPPDLWHGAPLEVALIGDSFARGDCVGAEETASAHIRRSFPRTVSLGMESFGPLLELAALKEYLPAARPRRVVWLYDESNDLVSDLDREKTRSLLLRYLEPDHLQHLESRQAEVDDFWKATLARQQQLGPAPAGRLRRWKGRLLAWSRLRTLRGRVGLQASGPQPDFSRVDLILFRRILQTARDSTRDWGGELYFAYLPTEASVRMRRPTRGEEDLRRSVLKIVQDLGIPLIDLLPVLQSEPNPDSLYAFPGSHFAPKGYALLGEGIVSGLRESE